MLAKSEADGLRAHRQALLSVAAGDVLEIGGGTGVNLPFYTGRCGPARSPSPRSRWPGGWKANPARQARGEAPARWPRIRCTSASATAAAGIARRRLRLTPAWLDGLDAVLEQLAAEIRHELGGEPDSIRRRLGMPSPPRRRPRGDPERGPVAIVDGRFAAPREPGAYEASVRSSPRLISPANTYASPILSMWSKYSCGCSLVSWL
jgi:hypothetical protein